MGALGHVLEAAGLPTTQISLIREQTQRMRPPRALWVPFELGRPFGAPHDAGFQTRVLEAALRLLEAPSGPVLEDFPEDAPAGGSGAGDGTSGWACPIPPPPPEDEADLDLPAAFARELSRLLPWYDLARERTGRTTVGLSGMAPEALGDFLARLLEGEPPPSPSDDVPLALAFKYAVEDLRALYTEAATAQPGGRPPGGGELSDWLWNETRAGDLLRALRERLLAGDDAGLRLVARAMLVPVERLAPQQESG